MRIIASAFGILALAGIGSQAQAQTLKVDYDISLMGLPLGRAEVNSTFKGSRYKVEGNVKLSGLAQMLTGGKGAASASGAIVDDQLRSRGFAVTAKTSGEQRTVRMGLKGGRVEDVTIDPPLEEKPDRIPVTEAHKRGVVDPVSAILMPAVARRSLTDAGNCNRTIPIFDGASRFDVVLSYAETTKVDLPGYSGPALVCNARYVPIAGHRSERPGTKFMRDNKEMSVWLAPVEGQRVLFPVKVAVQTMIGMSVLEASSWSLEGTAKAAPAAGRRVKAEHAIRAGAVQ